MNIKRTYTENKKCFENVQTSTLLYTFWTNYYHYLQYSGLHPHNQYELYQGLSPLPINPYLWLKDSVRHQQKLLFPSIFPSCSAKLTKDTYNDIKISSSRFYVKNGTSNHHLKQKTKTLNIISWRNGTPKCNQRKVYWY